MSFKSFLILDSSAILFLVLHHSSFCIVAELSLVSILFGTLLGFAVSLQRLLVLWFSVLHFRLMFLRSLLMFCVLWTCLGFRVSRLLLSTLISLDSFFVCNSKVDVSSCSYFYWSVYSSDMRRTVPPRRPFLALWITRIRESSRSESDS